MAFESVDTNQFKTYLTRVGLRKLLQPGNTFNIKYFGFTDEGVNYNLVDNEPTLVTSVTADSLKTLYNGSPNLDIVGNDVAPRVDDISKRELVFVRECDNEVSEFRNATVDINVGNYLKYLQVTQNNLSNVASDFTPLIKVFDYVKVYEYVENAFNELKLWNTKDEDVVYNFNTVADYNNYKTLTNTFVKSSSSSVKVNYNNNRFKSPFMLSFTTQRTETGVIKQNGEFVFEAYPVESFGYLVDGSFIQPQELTQSRYDNSRNIIPVANFLGINHEIDTDPNRVYKPNVNNVLFRFPDLIDTTVSAAKNLFEFYGNDTTNTNEKLITIDFNVTAGGVDYLDKPAILKVNFILSLDDSTWEWDPHTDNNNILTINGGE